MIIVVCGSELEFTPAARLQKRNPHTFRVARSLLQAAHTAGARAELTG